MIDELHHLMNTSPTGIKKVSGAYGMVDRIEEWLQTPQGTLIDMPSWGHNLKPFQHEPPGESLNVMLEMAIANKMPMDIDNLMVNGIKAEFVEIDLCILTINYQYGVFSTELSL